MAKQQAALSAQFDLEPPEPMEGIPGWRISFGDDLHALIDPNSLAAVGLALALYLMAAVLANEWLYLLSAGLGMVALLGTLLPLLSVASVDSDCWMPDTGLAYEAAEIAISLRQRQTFWILTALIPCAYLRARVLLARRTTKGYAAETTLARQPILVESLGQQAILKFTIPALQRGIYKLSKLEVTTSFPFGMVWWTRSFKPEIPASSSEAIVVYPRTESLRGNFLLQLKGAQSTMGLAFTDELSLATSTSVRTIRDFRLGDSLRQVHWRSTARLGKMVVREFDCETLPVFDIYLNLAANWMNREQFELAITIVNSLINFGNQHDMMPQLFMYPTADSEQLAPLLEDLPLAQTEVELLLETLARVEPMPQRSGAPKDLSNRSRYRQLLTLVPSGEKVVRYSAAHGDQIVYPILLAVIDPDADGGLRTPRQDVAQIFAEEDLQAI